MEITTNEQLFESLVEMIENSRKQVSIQINYTITLLFWQVGKREVN